MMKPLEYVEKYGIIEYKVKNNIMTYYASYIGERSTYKCIVDLNTGEEIRQKMKRYHKKYNCNA